jgi:hypothetical protein
MICLRVGGFVVIIELLVERGRGEGDSPKARGALGFL